MNLSNPKSLMALAAVLASGLLSAGALAADSKTDLVGDIDCDGHLDEVSYSVSQDAVRLDVKLRAQPRVAMLMTFSIGLHSQGSLCAAPVSVALESLDFDPKEEVGDLTGLRRSTICKGIVLDDKQCDAIHVYWNRDTHALAFWRL